MRELAVGIAIGGIIWVLPCLYEIRMSPTLLSTVYGISRFEGTRLGSWRPFVFFSTGLELGMWMTAASLSAVWLWWCGSLKRPGPIRSDRLVLPILLITTFFCRATGALALLIAGLTILWLGTRFGTKLLLCALLLAPPLYYAVRIPNSGRGDDLVQFIRTYINKERAESLSFRFQCENLLVKKALIQPAFGWAGWGGNRVIDEDGRDSTPTDGMWIIYLGFYGLVGLITWTTMLLLPSWLFVLRTPARQWRDPTGSPMAAMATLLGLYMVDCLANGFMNLSYVVAAGGLASTASTLDKSRRRNREVSHDDKHADLNGSSVNGPDLEHVPPTPDRPSTSPSTAGASATATQERLADRYWQLARKLRTEGRLDEAKSMLSYSYELLSKLAAAQPSVREIQKQRWNCANDLAWLLLNQSEPVPEELHLAVDLGKQATEADGEIATYWNTLGAACYRVGDSANAITALERSMV